MDLNNNIELENKINDILLTITNERKHLLLYGFGGTGKTYTLNTIIRKLLSSGNATTNNLFATAPTGIAALNLFRGQTLHKWAGVGIRVRDYKYSLSKIESSSFTLARWRETKYLIIDEISMVSCEFFERIDALAKEVRHSDLPFGGIQLILSGDFLQLPPVKEKYVFTGNVFNQIFFSKTPLGKIFLFDTPYRFNDIRYFELLSRFRIADPSEEDINLIKTRLTIRPDPNDPIKPTILYSKNVDVNQYNMNELDKLDYPSYLFKCYDSYTPVKKTYQVFKEYYEALFDEAIPPSIELKVGAQVILKYNIDLEIKHLANGSRGIITEILDLRKEPALAAPLTELNIQVKVKFRNGHEIFVPWRSWEVIDKFVHAKRTQIPLILGWATTIHKSQGQTLDYVTTKIGKDVFLDGQMYVALSRVKNLESLFVTDFDSDQLKADISALEITKKIEEKAVNRKVEVADEIEDEDIETEDGDVEDDETLLFTRDKKGNLILITN